MFEAWTPAARAFEREVNELAAELIRTGRAAPFDAVVRAREIVIERRRRESSWPYRSQFD
jgi:hypothetical protein